MNIVLIGMMASGKSTVGRVLAEMLGRPFLDTDAMVEAEANRSIPAIFAEEGEAGFRAREARAVAAATSVDGRVIATGGGAVLSPANRELLRRGSLVFWLDASPEELCARAVKQDVAGRPLLAGDALAQIRSRLKSRAAAYAAAAHHRIWVEGCSATGVADAVLTIVKAAEGDIGHAAGTGKP
ncbi:MAG TPA: shikimate kinase [Symbiobacteriaceae bacterium]|nr:shikimate kinase [Symbiobacteriaceae bacterium]